MDPITFLVCGRNCSKWVVRSLHSLRRQSDPGWRAIVVDDASEDETYARIRKVTLGDPRFRVVRNRTRLYGLESRLRCAEEADASGAEVMAVLDMDDWLAGSDVVARLREVYRDQTVWLTYGSYRRYKPERWFFPLRPRVFPERGYAPEEFTGRGIREAPWLGTHLRTFRAFLFAAIPRESLLADDGAPLRSCEDQALMFPMLEMAGWKHSRHLPEPLYVYNRHQDIIERSRRAEQLAVETMLRTRRPSEPLLAPPAAVRG